MLDHPQERFFLDEVKALGARVFEMPSFHGTNIVEIISAWNNFFSDHPEYHIIHSHVRSYASIYLFIAKMHGLKTIIHSHSTSNGKGFIAIIKDVMQFPLRYQADAFLACSDEAGKWLFGKKVLHSPHYLVLKNGIDISQYTPNQNVRQIYRTQLGLSDHIVYMHVGRMHVSKNHHFLIEVFSQIREKQPDAKLALIGDGELRPAIEEQVKAEGLSDDVLFLGNRKDVPKLLQAADCFLLPSLWEGFAISIIEAQAAGLMCFASDQLPNEPIVSDVVRQLPVNDDDVSKWANEILHCSFRRIDQREALIRNGLDIQSVAMKLSEFYNRLNV